MPPVEVERRVRFDHEDLDGVRMMIRSDGDVVAGATIEVEVGARFAHVNSSERVSGVWVPCTVVSDSPRELVVRLL